ncbi:hypothetical protein ANANG_G00089910 [Anguilla anguilla]|uniref:Uncharacterized protein n=1 Tax=Anguilla anguilla TaxID=7936 RepID=A0A9D3MLM1_ANGAN|nr:hypothetical protein ANANG_G00089910 [Anguilla anguilla]
MWVTLAGVGSQGYPHCIGFNKSQRQEAVTVLGETAERSGVAVDGGGYGRPGNRPWLQSTGNPEQDGVRVLGSKWEERAKSKSHKAELRRGELAVSRFTATARTPRAL